MAFFATPYESLLALRTPVVAVLLGLSLLGFLFDLLAHRPRDRRETFTNLVIFMVNNTITFLLAQGLQIGGLTWLAHFSPFSIPSNALTFALCLLGVDFCYYWRHRWEHEINLLWAEHSVHHSSEEFNFSTSVRLPAIGPLFSWIFFAPLALLGFPAKLILATFFINLLYQYWVHNGAIGRLRWFDKVFSSPSNHRVHHARNPEYLDKNYGGILVVWDHLFGTYTPERAKPDFGIVVPIGTQNPVLVNTRPFARLFAKAKIEPGFRGKLRVVFGRP